MKANEKVFFSVPLPSPTSASAYLLSLGNKAHHSIGGACTCAARAKK